MKTYLVELTGRTSLLHHKMTEEVMMNLLQGDKGKKKVTKEYRTPREIASDHVYQDKEKKYFYIPMGYVVGAFSHVAADYKQTGSRKSIKTIASGVFVPCSDKAVLLNPKNSKPLKDWEVQIDKATCGNAGKGTAVVVCRPRFDEWKTRFYVELEDDLLAPDRAEEILSDSGRRAGIGSWRVNKGGVYGKFSVTMFKEVKEMKEDKLFKL